MQSQISFKIDSSVKQDLTNKAKSEGLNTRGLLTQLILGYINGKIQISASGNCEPNILRDSDQAIESLR